MPLRLFTLGDLRLEGRAGSILAGRRKELVLLAVVARRSPRLVARDELCALLWGERDESKAKQSLRHALHRLRGALGDAIEVTSEHARVPDGVIEVDATALEKDVAAGRFADAVARWRGDFLSGAEDAGPEPFRAWLEGERERLRRLASTAFARLFAGAPPERESGANVQLARRWFELFPLDSAASSALIAALVDDDKVDEASALHAAALSRMRADAEAPAAEFIRLGDEVARRFRQIREPRPGSAALLTPDLVGRDAQLASVMALWSHIRVESAVVVIEGEEGAGKSRICSELAQRVRAGDPAALILDTEATNQDGETPFGTVRRLLTPVIEAKAIEDVSNKALGELSGIVPGVRDRFPHVPSPSGIETRLHRALRDVVGALAGRTPVLLVVDDFARADASSRQLLLALARDLPVATLMVFTARSAELVDSALAAELASVPTAQRLRLPPLSGDEVALLLRSMLELDPNDCEVLAERLLSESGGNPFYLIELVLTLADAGVIRLTRSGRWELDRQYDARALPLPPGIRAAIKLRLSHLNAPARTLLNSLAARDRLFDIESARRLPDFDPEGFEDALHELLARRLLRLGSDGHSFEFTHDLIRRIVAEEASAKARLTGLENGSSLSTPTRRTRNRRYALAGSAIAVMALVAVAVAAYVRGRASTGVTSAEARVMVVPFTNQTGDPQLDPLARIAADWMTQGITQSGLVAVMPLAVGTEATRSASARGGAVDWPKLAKSAEPTLVISGAVYRNGDSLRFDARITDARRGKPLRGIESAVTAVTQPMVGLEAMRQHVLAALGPLVDVRLASSAHVQSRPPSYEAYRAFAGGLDLMYARDELALAEFARAYALDSSFTLPLLYEAMTYDGLGNYAAADSLARLLTPRRARLAPYDRHLLDYVIARIRGDRAGEYAASRAAALLAPGSLAAVLLAPRAAVALNLPGEAVRLLSAIDAEQSAANGLPAYWNVLAHAQHMLGHYHEQLVVAKDVGRRLPREERALYYESRALAALGRRQELDAALAAGLTWPSVPMFGPPGLGLHTIAWEELRAHGHSRDADEILRRAVRFYEKMPAEIRRIPRHRNDMSRALFALGRLKESRALLEQLVAESPLSAVDMLSIVAQLAVVCAAQGDLRRVDELSQRLTAASDPYLFGVHTFQLARIAAALGRREEAVRLLRQATSEGKTFDHTLHHIVEFQRLRGYAPFEEWLRPKG